REKRRWPQVLSAAVLLLAGCVLVQLATGPTPHGRGAPGGVVGVAIAGELVGLFSVVGTVILVSALALAALLVGSQFALLRAVVAVGHALGVLAGRLRSLGVACWEAQRRRWDERLKARAAAKLEEAAFLA